MKLKESIACKSWLRGMKPGPRLRVSDEWVKYSFHQLHGLEPDNVPLILTLASLWWMISCII
jgi:hypothetical protein